MESGGPDTRPTLDGPVDHATLDRATGEPQSLDHASLDRASLDRASLDHTSVDHTSQDSRRGDGALADAHHLDTSPPDARPPPLDACFAYCGTLGYCRDQNCLVCNGIGGTYYGCGTCPCTLFSCSTYSTCP
jgi:hypothetical protein